MRGDELCKELKNNIETSHIPVILLTALNNEKDILSGLKIGADEYILKPFNIGILKATVDNLLTNRALLRSKYANLELDDEEEDDECINCSQDIDWKFIAILINLPNRNFLISILKNHFAVILEIGKNGFLIFVIIEDHVFFSGNQTLTYRPPAMIIFCGHISLIVLIRDLMNKIGRASCRERV